MYPTQAMLQKAHDYFDSIVDYVLHSLHATDFKISEISIEDIVKSILKEQEEGVKNV